VRFTGTPVITHGASLVLPGAANITAAAGDFAVFRGYAASVVRCTQYQRSSGKPVIGPASTDVTDSTTTGRALLTAASVAAARTTLAIDAVTTHGDSIYTILATDRYVATSAALTAARTWTLCAANAVPAGTEILVSDAAGGCTLTLVLTVARAGSDTINGVGSNPVINRARGRVKLRSDGSSNWTIVGYSRARKITEYLSGSGSHTTEPFCSKMRVRGLAGGGGGAAGSGSSTGTGSTGGTTTFGSSLLSASGGVGGSWANTTGGAGGTASVSSPAIGFTQSGGTGGGVNGYTGSSVDSNGGDGGSTPFGSAQGGGPRANAATAPANSGCGGGGGGSNAGSGAFGGAGGGGGGYFEATINAPASTFSYAVGAGGNSATSGAITGAVSGADGRIIVEEDFD
jgi:hypothetical protein